MSAIAPNINATVTASAGSGKTWLLVSRIVRLMLAGQAPGGILALTFTRKAASEMQQRLGQRLYELATADEHRLELLLKQIDLPPSAAVKQAARTLYPQHQYCDYPLRAQTFHAFCQDILARFPLEAEVPPGFALLDNETLLKNQALDALFNEAARNMQGELAQQLQDLMQACGGYEQLKKVLDAFINQRSDWWAYTHGIDNPAQHATQKLQHTLQLTSATNPIDYFFQLRADIKTFANLLRKKANASDINHADNIDAALALDSNDENTFNQLRGSFLTQSNTIIVQGRKESAAMRKALGPDTDRFLALNNDLGEAVIQTLDFLNRLSTLQLNRHWYTCGEHYLQLYQNLKRNMRLLDFTDLEWKTFQLLRHADNAHWVQYKLDQRIDHLLIDEFQDTNPTQWQLLLPLLQEMAAGDSERSRSVFLVGDEKQSIYSFRRAKPELQAIASSWLTRNLGARSFPLNKSWRSSPAIIDFVNSLFALDDMRALLPEFPVHETHKPELAGEVVALPAQEFTGEADAASTAGEAAAFRNPLLQPRTEAHNLHEQEGRQIAQQIRQLVDGKIAIQADAGERAIQYDDIFILLRKRTHVAAYEKALREANIPYIGAIRGSLLDCIEIDDMLALLDTLLTPFNNLALAQVLRSPLFNADDAALMQIADYSSTALWIDRLAELASQLDADHPLRRAHTYLGEWSALADRIPVHDLLDRIYHQSQLIERYVATSPPSLRPRVRANLIRFLELALDLDSGRYPSLMHFLLHIRELQQQERDAPDEAPMQTADARVRIMTIHASKGLEAPVVFLADTINSDPNRDTLSAQVEWPAQAERPTHIQLIPGKDERDQISETCLETQLRIKSQEQLHLLYVAVTRAKQCLYISACRPKTRAATDWYTPIVSALRALTNDDEAAPAWRHKQLMPGREQEKLAVTAAPTLPPFYFNNVSPIERVISPSSSPDAGSATGDADGQQRGIMIHRALELLTRQPAWSPRQIAQTLSHEMQLAADDALITTSLAEARALVNDPAFHDLFFPPASIRAVNECALSYKTDTGQVIGMIDRLLISDSEIVIADYKSHRVSEDETAELVAQYRSQMRHYADGARLAWPGRKVKSCLVFTYCRKRVVVDTSGIGGD